MLLSPGEKRAFVRRHTEGYEWKDRNCSGENKSRKMCKLGEAQQIVKRCADYVVEEMDEAASLS